MFPVFPSFLFKRIVSTCTICMFVWKEWNDIFSLTFLSMFLHLLLTHLIRMFHLHVCCDDKRRMSGRSQCRTSHPAALDLSKEGNIFLYSFSNLFCLFPFLNILPLPNYIFYHAVLAKHQDKRWIMNSGKSYLVDKFFASYFFLFMTDEHILTFFVSFIPKKCDANDAPVKLPKLWVLFHF